MAERYPAMNIHFPSVREADLLSEMQRIASAPWTSQPHDTFNRPPQDGYFYFHRDVVGDHPSCTLCVRREKGGHWIVQNIVPDEDQPQQIPLDAYKTILSEFESQIAEPAADSVKGVTAIELSHYRLEDYFSRRAIGLLETFCETSNGYGSNPSDQEKWMWFLIAAYDDGDEIPCDVFGNCLKTAKWWPEDGIPRLVREYDFSMSLLQHSGRTRNAR
ncbi:MAG: hypothetical protein AAGJ40_20440 [Planctomycetota bacterium]